MQLIISQPQTIAVFGVRGRSASQAECEACHPRSAEPDALGRRFGRVADHFGAYTGCVTCHADPHGGRFDAPDLPASVDGRAGCARCHDAASFRSRGAGFDHGRWTRFPLDGKHATVDCASCHEPLGAAAVLLVTFGIVVGAGIVRYSEPDPMAGQPQAGSRPLAQLPTENPPAPAGAPPMTGGTGGTGRVIPPEVLRGMLQAARTSLAEGRYGEAIAAYQAVLKRDARNVDALTHMGLIVAIGGHADVALETLDKALAIDPEYPPAYLYRGQVLYEQKQDYAGAVKSWQQFLALVPKGAQPFVVHCAMRFTESSPAAENCPPQMSVPP